MPRLLLGRTKDGAYTVLGIPNVNQVTTTCLPNGYITEQNGMVNNIYPSPDGEELKIDDWFDKTYAIYPRKQGKAKGLASYKAYLCKGKEISGTRYRFNHQQVYIAVQKYADECAGKDSQYVKHFDTFMNGPIVDYVEQTTL